LQGKNPSPRGEGNFKGRGVISNKPFSSLPFGEGRGRGFFFSGRLGRGFPTMRIFPAHAGEGIGVGSVISITQTEGHKEVSCVDKTLTPPLPLPYRGGESLAISPLPFGEGWGEVVPSSPRGGWVGVS